MKKLLLLFLLSFSFNSYADAICMDGWRSNSSGSGTCSWHGGVYKWLDEKKSYDYDNDNDYEPVRDKKPVGSPCSRVRPKDKKKCLEDWKIKVKAAEYMQNEMLKEAQEGMKLREKQQEFRNDLYSLSPQELLKKYSSQLPKNLKNLYSID